MTTNLTPPVLLVPKPSLGVDLFTSITSLTLVVQTPANAIFVQATVLSKTPGMPSNVYQSTTVLYEYEFISDAFNKYFSLPVSLNAGDNNIVLQYFTVFPSASSTDLAAAASPTVIVPIQLDTTYSHSLAPKPPTNFSISQRALDVRVSWATPQEIAYKGNNLYMASTSGGPYFKVNSSPILAQDPSSSAARTFLVIPLSAIPKEYIGTTYSSAYTFYGVVTTMIQTSTGMILESPNSVELDLKFYTFPSEYTSPINRHEADIQNGLINSINSYESTLDIKPGSVLQDIFVNPVATEFARAYQRLHFYHYAGSLPTLTKYEDENGDGVPDTLAQSPLRQQLYQAFNLSSSSEVQTWIDMAFERLASLQFDARRGATTASGVVTFYTNIRPNRNISIPAGTVVTSSTTTLSGITPPSFKTIETGVIPIQGLDSYYNASLARWQIKLHVIASTSGTAGNIGAGVLNYVSSIPNLKVTNEANLYGGQDLESNLDLGARLRNCYLAKDPGRKAGIVSWITQSAGIYSCNVVGAGDAYMMRDYDELRQRHVYGRADAYVDSRAISEKSQIFVMSPSIRTTGITSTTTTVVSANTTNWQISINDSILSSNTPIYQVVYVKNQTKGIWYNLTGCSVTNSAAGSAQLFLDAEANADVSLHPIPDLTDTIELQLKVFYTPGFLLNTQPVLSINSITGEALTSGGAGIIDLTSVEIFVNQDPMGKGGSVRDSAYMVVKPTMITHAEPMTFPSSGGGLDPLVYSGTYMANMLGVAPAWVYSPTIININEPSATFVEGVHYSLNVNEDQKLVVTRLNLDPTQGYVLTYQTYNIFPRKFTVVGEPLVLNGSAPAYLMNIGVDVNSPSFQVTSDMAGLHPLTRYGQGLNPAYRVTPYDSAQLQGSSSPYDEDYWAAQSDTIEGVLAASKASLESPVGIINTDLSQTPDGSTVYVTYEYYENLTVLYSVDQGVIDAQALVEKNRSCTADILVKRCNTMPATAQLTVTLTLGASQTTVDASIRTAVYALFNALGVGDGVVESELIRAVKSVPGVANVVVPLDRLSFSDGAMMLQESLPLWQVTTELGTTETPIYKSQTRTLYSSIPNGGEEWEYVAVYEDGLAMKRTHTVEEFLSTAAGDYGTFFLAQSPIDYRLSVYVNPNRLASENADINTHAHTITYHIYGDNSTHDLAGSNLSIMTLGTLVINYSGV